MCAEPVEAPFDRLRAHMQAEGADDRLRAQMTGTMPHMVTDEEIAFDVG